MSSSRRHTFIAHLEPSLLTPTESKLYLGIGLTKLYALCKTGKLTPVKFGKRCTRFRKSELDALIAAHSVIGGTK
jgi:excisionase family DNA binding protein